jgi:hypothetical protein
MSGIAKYTAGTAPLITDTEWTLWAKILTRLGQITGDTKHPPLLNNTRHQLKTKVLKTLNYV